MLDKLYEGLNELPVLLNDRSNWDSLIVNPRQPWTYRVYSKLSNGLRVCLHRFEIFHTHEAFPHPHPWPGAILVLDGSYKMAIGYSVDRESPMLDVMTTVMGKWSAYEILNPLTWHAVIPLETTYTIMVNGTPWESDVAHREVRRAEGNDLEHMPEEKLVAHLAKFQKLINEYRKENVVSDLRTWHPHSHGT